MIEGPFCGCTRITYDPVDLGNGSKTERWTCAVQGGCGREFVPKARAEQALATVTAERDEARALAEDYRKARNDEVGRLRCAFAKAERERDAEVNAHDKLDDLAVAYANERDEARATASNYLERWNAEVERLRETLDTVIAREGSLKSKLAEAERVRDTLGRRIDEVQAALNECGAGVTGQKESTRIRALRARLAKAEAVVEADRKLATTLDRYCSLMPSSRPGSPEEDAFDSATRANEAALRALENDSGGSGAATSTGALGSAPEAGSTPEPAGSSCRCGAGCKPVPHYEGDGADDPPPAEATKPDLFRTLDPAALHDALKKPFDLCPRCHGMRTIGDGYMVGGLRLDGQVGGGAHEHRSPCPECSAPAEPAGDPGEPDPQAPSTRAELEELRREVLETVAEACDESEKRAYAPFPWPLTRLADVLRRRVERLEQLKGFAPKE